MKMKVYASAGNGNSHVEIIDLGRRKVPYSQALDEARDCAIDSTNFDWSAHIIGKKGEEIPIDEYFGVADTETGYRIAKLTPVGGGVEIEKGTQLGRIVWHFKPYVAMNGSVALRLVRYAPEVRSSPRHKWRIADGQPKRAFSTTENRDHWFGYGMDRKDVPMPDAVVELAKIAVMNGITIEGPK